MTTPGERRWWLWWRRRRKEGDDDEEIISITPSRPNQLLNTKLTREFTRLDTSQNGMLSREEVAEGLRERGLAVSKDNIDKFFFRVDSNRDGMICEKEYNKFVIQRVEECRSVYKKVDDNGDGRLTAAELRSAASELGFSISSEQLRFLLNKAEEESNGVISFDQFCLFLLLLPAVNPHAAFEALSTRYFEGSQSEYSPAAEVLSSYERKTLLASIAFKVYAGSVAGGVSRTVTAPLDLFKTMLQALPPGEPSRGVFTGLRDIYLKGGIRAFFRGNAVNVLKVAPETSIKFVSFDYLKGWIAVDRNNVTSAERFIAGGAAGAIAQISIYPLEIVKTRMQSGVYSGMFDCFRSVIRREGIGALSNGLGISVIGIVPFSGIDLMFNSVIKDAATRFYSERGEEPGVSVVLGCGMLSSTVAMLCTYPINLVRTRLQLNGMEGRKELYSGPLDVVRQALRAGGLRALYQGLVPNLLKVLPATSISYAVYDQLCKDAPGGGGEKEGDDPYRGIQRQNTGAE